MGPAVRSRVLLQLQRHYTQCGTFTVPGTARMVPQAVGGLRRATKAARRFEAPPDAAPLVASLFRFSFFFSPFSRFVNLQRNSGFCLLCYYRRVGFVAGSRLETGECFWRLLLGNCPYVEHSRRRHQQQQHQQQEQQLQLEKIWESVPKPVIIQI